MVNFSAFKNVECKGCYKDFVRATNELFCPDCRTERSAKPEPKVSAEQKVKTFFSCILGNYKVGDTFNIQDIRQKCNPEGWSPESCRKYLKPLIDQGYLIITKPFNNAKGAMMEYQLVKLPEKTTGA